MLIPVEWGPWRLDTERLALVGRGTYTQPLLGTQPWTHEINLMSCRTPSQVLLHILDVGAQPWDDDVVAALVEALDQILGLRSRLDAASGWYDLSVDEVHRLVAQRDLNRILPPPRPDVYP